MRSWVVLASVLLLLPVVHAEAVQAGIDDAGPAETTLYVHGEPASHRMVLNLREPDPAWSSADRLGGVTQTCVQSASDQAQGDVHTWYAIPSLAPVRYEDGGPRYGFGRSLVDDLRLDADAAVRLVWYLEGEVDGRPALLPAPNVVLRATLRTGDDASIDHAARNAGDLIAQGETSPALLAGPATDHPDVRYASVDIDGETRHVYEFSLRLAYEDRDEVRVSADDGFNLRVDVFVENPACTGPDARVMPPTVRLHSSDGHRPRFTWEVLAPLRIAYFVPQFVDSDLVVHAKVQSPWGRPDTDGVRLTVEGPTTPVHAELIEWSPPRTHDDPLGLSDGRDLTWVWDLEADRPEDGLYVVQLTAENHQGTATATAVATFEVGTGTVVACTGGPDGPRCTESAAPPRAQSPAPLAVAALLAALALRRRA